MRERVTVRVSKAHCVPDIVVYQSEDFVMPKKAVEFNAEQNTGVVLFTMDKPANAPEDYQPVVHKFDLDKVSQAILVRLALHGASQKIGDSYAGAKDSGEDPIAYAESAVRETIKQLEEGNWSVTRTGTGAPRTSMLAQALAAVKGITLEAAIDAVSELNDDDKKTLQQNKKIAAKIAGLKAEQALARAKAAEAAAEKEDADKAAAEAGVQA